MKVLEKGGAPSADLHPEWLVELYRVFGDAVPVDAKGKINPFVNFKDDSRVSVRLPVRSSPSSLKAEKLTYKPDANERGCCGCPPGSLPLRLACLFIIFCS